MNTTDTFEEFLSVTKALSDGQRVRVLMSLRRGELCVCQITEFLDLAPSTVSKHMSILKQAGLVESRKDSRWVYYRIVEKRPDSIAVKYMEFLNSVIAEDPVVMNDQELMSAVLERVVGNCERKEVASVE